MKKLNKLTLFLILTFVISYSLVGVFLLIGGVYKEVSGIILAVLYMFVPMIVAIIIERGIHKNKIKKNFAISFKLNKWFLVAWLIAPVLSFLTLGISLLFPDVHYSPEMSGMIERFQHMMTAEQITETRETMDALPFHPIWIALLQGLVAGISVNALAGFGEELGWRGMMVRELRKKSFVKASLIIGFVWGIWHAPLILMGHNYPEHPQIGVIMMTAWCILLSPLFLYITIKAKSVIAAAVMHGTLNATAGLAIMVVDGGNDLTVGMTGLAGFIALSITIITLFLVDKYVTKEHVFQGKILSHLEYTQE